MADLEAEHVAAPSTGHALAGLLTSCASLVLCPPAGTVGVILSVIAWRRATMDPAAYAGKGMAVAGAIVGTISAVALPLLAVGVVLPALNALRSDAAQIQCLNNIQALARGLIIYDETYDDLPPADNWVNLLIAEDLARPEMFVCPEARDPSVISYHYVPLPDVTPDTDWRLRWNASTVVLYEWPPHHAEGGHVCYADTSVVIMDPESLQALIDSLTLPDGTPVTAHLHPMPAP